MKEEPTVIPKAYDSIEVEARWYSRWEEAGIFTASASDTIDGGVRPYTIMMPPPNVTGTLHNGHALFVTLQDILIRCHRMRGDNVLWVPGVDHAGIATQTVVERDLYRREGQTRHDVGRDAFIERVWQWKEQNGSRITQQLKVLGASADWTRERFTLDDQCSRAVREAFVRLWEEGLIYRSERLISWDPTAQTALSNEEVNHEKMDGELWRFAYPVAEDDREIVVATTRPETMLGDTAVAVHPEDDRYASLVGKRLKHPFFPERELRVIADSAVDREFGTGAVKVTPAHDQNDFDIGQRHGLVIINIFDFDANVNENGGAYQGLNRYTARERIKADISALGLERGSESINHSVAVSERSGDTVEPMLSRQYFVSTAPLAAKACAAIDELNQTRILPESWKSTWDHFMKEPRDWCISRQLWWGHRIPVFYDLQGLRDAVREDGARKGGNSTALRKLEAGGEPRELLQVALNTLDDDLVRSFSVASRDDLCDGPEGHRFLQDDDVLDTWFSAGLWPFSTLGWPDETPDLRAFYPSAVLETGFDILFFWVARMMMFGCHLMGEAPFRDVFLHAMVRDSQGRKMSKSLGNAIDPLDVINGISLDGLLEKTRTYPVPQDLLPEVLTGLGREYPDGIPASGADGLRFSLAALSGQGRDVKLSIPRVAGYRAFLNKIWNATRFVLMSLPDSPPPSIDTVSGQLSLSDRWILSRLQVAVQRVGTSIDEYRFHDAANSIYNFFWKEFCDWYLEFVKVTMSDSAVREISGAVLVHVLDSSMRLMHPICPFQTEEIWQRLPGRDDRWGDAVPFCAVAPFPTSDLRWQDAEAESAIDSVIDVISHIRNLREASGIVQSRKIDVIVFGEKAEMRANLISLESEILRIGRLSSFTVYAEGEITVPRQAAVHDDAGIRIIIPLEGLIDLDAERSRIEDQLAKSRKELQGYQRKLANSGYIDNAPAEIVQETRDRATRVEGRIDNLVASLGRL